MPIKILYEGDEVAAWDEEVLEIGFGATEEEARANLMLGTRDTHRELRELGPDRLGPNLVRVLAVLDAREVLAEQDRDEA
jgi:hypothetical protein